MSISIICSRCNTPYNLPVNMAGKTVVCKKCKALLDIPGAGAAPPRAVLPSMVASGNARYNHIVGKPAPILFDILGLYTQWQSESVWRDVVRLVWSFHHLVLLIVLIVMWTLYAQTPQSAVMAAPFFLIAAILVLLVAWLQISSIGRSIAQDIGAGKRDAPAVLPYLLSSFVLIVTEPRAALPALRTAFLAIMTLIAALSLASEGGSWTYVVPITSLPSFSTPPASKATAPPPPTSSVKPPETPPATAPTPPSPPPAPPEEKPLPPPEDNNPLPPP